MNLPTFTKTKEQFEQEAIAKGEKPSIRDFLKWHVPLLMRGDFRPQDLANYDPNKKYRTDPTGRLLCYGYTKAGFRCKHLAVNRYPRCKFHGGQLHPFDKIKPPATSAESLGAQENSREKSRYRLFQEGLLTTDDLDDEELATCSFRGSNGRLYKPKTVSREMAHAFTRAIFDRAQTEMRSHTVEAAKTIAQIMMDDHNDPEIRLKAAKELIERNLGRTPQVVAITATAPWEQIFDGIASGTREESRAKRQIETTRGDTPPNQPKPLQQPAIDAEVIEDQEAHKPKDRLFERNPAILAQTLEIDPDAEPPR